MKGIVVFFGMTASGKSTLGRLLAETCQGAYYNTDCVRKELAGVAATAKRPDGLDQGLYSLEKSEQTYAELLARARRDLLHGRPLVVLDGSYAKQRDREQVIRLAAELGVECVFIECVCTEAEVRRRLTLRARDPESVSDGRWEIYCHQRQTFEPPDESEGIRVIRLDTEGEPAVLLARLEALLKIDH